MLVGDLRTLLINFLGTNLRIDEWGLGLPQSVRNFNSPPSIGLDKPALDLIFLDDEAGFGESFYKCAETTIPMQVIYRFDNSYKYADLPRAEAENILSGIILKLLACECLHPDIQLIKPAGSVSIAETKSSDWLLIFEIDFFVKFQTSHEQEKSKLFQICPT